MKRVFDLIFAIILILLLLPIMAILVIAIFTTSSGEIFFKQTRIGKNKKQFLIYKFRTMYIDAPKDVPTHLLNNADAWITPIGTILRKTSLDELPQLINIIKGDMSFVGPRPALYNQYDLISLRDEYKINKVLPGITGWAQINGRDELEISKKVEFDKYYVQNQSFFFDIYILIKTLYSVILKKGIVEGRKEGSKERVKL